MTDELDKAIEGALSELEITEEHAPLVSREELLAAYMSSLSFRPKSARADGTTEYFKVYSDPSGRIGRVVAVIKKDEVGLEPKNVDYFTLTIQVHIPATEEGVNSKAPAVVKNDLFRILAHFDDVDERAVLMASECSECGVSSGEFMESPETGKMICLTCGKRKGFL